MDTDQYSDNKKYLINDSNCNFQINYIPKEKIKFSSKLYNENYIYNPEPSINESFSCFAKDQKCFLIENITSFFKTDEFKTLIQVKYYL